MRKIYGLFFLLCLTVSSRAVEKRVFAPVPAEAGKRYRVTLEAAFSHLLPGAAADLQTAALDGAGKTLKRYQNPPRFQMQYVTGVPRRFELVTPPLPSGTKQLRAEFLTGGNPIAFTCGEAKIIPYTPEKLFAGVYGPGDPPVQDRDQALAKMAKLRPVRAEVRKINGDPALFFDGEMVPYAAYSGDKDFGLCAASGANIAISSLGSSLYWSVPWDRAAHVGNGRFDFTRLENELLRIHQTAPGMRVLVSVNCNPDDAWLEKHPGSIFTSEDGRPGNARHCGFAGFGRKPDHKKQLYYAVSYASREYQDYAVAGLRELGKFLKNSPAGNIVAGFRLSGGHDGQFVQWQYSAEPQGHMDYSAGHLAAFRDYLREKYRTPEALRKAWGEPGIDFASARLFSKKEFKSRPYFAPGDGPGQKIADCREFVSLATARLLRRFGGALKESFGRPCVVQTWYSSAIWQQLGRSSLDELAAGNEIDIVAMVTDYAPPRLPGCPGGAANFAIGAAKLRGLLYVQELDHRAWYAQRIAGWNYTAYPADAREFHAQAMRDAASVLASGGYGFYWYDMFGSWYRDPAAQRTLRESFELGRRSLRSIGRGEHAECAIFLDERARFRYEGASSAIGRKIWRLSGIDFDTYHLNDLTNPELPEYKAYVCFSPMTITREEAAALLKRSRGKALMIAGESGFLSPDFGSARALAAYFGLRVQDRAAPQYRVAEFVPAPDTLGTRLAGRTGLLWGRIDLNGRMVYPTQARDSVVTDPEAVTLAFWQGTREPAVACKRTPERLLVYSAHNGGVSPQLLHNFARAAGVRQYAEPGNVLMAGRGVALFHRLNKAPGRIEMGRNVTWFDALTRKKLGSGSAISLETPPMTTRAVIYE